MSGRPLHWLLLGGAIVAAVLVGVALRTQRTTRPAAAPAVPEPVTAARSADDPHGAAESAVGLPPADGGAVPESAEDPLDEPNTWAAVDLEAVRRAMPDNLYWRMSSPTRDEAVLRERAEERARWNEAYGKVLSNTATEQEIIDYYAHRDRLASDYVQFATYILENYGEQLSIRDLGLMKVAVELNLATLEQIPRQIEEAQQRRVAHEQAREAWRRDQADFGAPDDGTTK
ncbi:hypothetical protein K2Z84_20270 [Candidatus Binatia bacterium]|nr:hypothetical protein [Candidatus Binatia bacterium]